MKKMPTINQIFSNNRIVLILSLLAAVVSWIVVAMTSADTIPQTIYDVPVNLDIKSQMLADVGLSIVPIGETLVNVHVNGQRTVVGNLKPEDLIITARVSGITEPTTRDLTLVCEEQTEGFDIVSIEPATIRVRLDEFANQTFPVALEQGSIAMPPDHLPGTPTISPSAITVRGPRSELERIHKVVAVVELEQELFSTYADTVKLTLLDAAGGEIIPAGSSLEVSNDNVYVIIPVHKTKTVPLRIDITNKPDDFPEEKLMGYAVASKDYIRIEGPVGLIDSTSEILAGTIDLRTITPENNGFEFDLTLPEQLENLENIRSVRLTFASEYWTTKTFNVNNIYMAAGPPGFSVELLTTSLAVTFAGPEDVIDNMNVDDIVAEVRLADQVLEEGGQYRYPIRLSAPTKELAWAVGDYSVLLQVEERNKE